MLDPGRDPKNFSEEIQAHLDLEAARLQSEGIGEHEARAAARKAFGNISAAEERFYENGRWIWLDQLRQDLAYAFRTLRHAPGFAIAAVLTLALGIGANTAIFSVIDTALLKPLPYAEPNRLVRVYARVQNGGISSLSPADFLEYRKQGALLQYFAAYRETPFNVTGRDQPERISGSVVSADFFSVLAMPAQIGNTFTTEPNVAVLSYGLWQRRYAGDKAVLGRTIDLDGKLYAIVGVMPKEFQFPALTELWASSPFAVPPHPLRPETDPSTSRDTHYLDTVGRLHAQSTLMQAQTAANTIAARLKQQYKDDEEGVGAALIPLRQDLVGDTRPALLMLTGAVTLLLLIACVNVANILLARGASRQKEIAIRGALGARRMRLVRQLLVESILLALAGGAIGVLFAHWGIGPLQALAPPDLNTGALHLDMRVLAFTTLLSFACGIVFGLFPAFQLASTELNGVLKEAGRGLASGGRANRVRGTLVVCEIAFATVLLIGAGLLIRSFNLILAVPHGFHPEHVLSLRLSLPRTRYPQPAARVHFISEVLNRATAIPGVTSAAAISRLPLVPGASSRSVDFYGRSPSTANDLSPDYLVITPDYFRVMGIPVLKGRSFTDRDNASAPIVVIVGESMARYFWPGENPVGKLVKVGPCKDWCQVVGVAGDVHQHHLDQPPPPALYLPYAQDPWPFMAVVARTGMDPASLASAMQAAVHAVDKDQPVYAVRTMQQVVALSVSGQRLHVSLLGLFALVALTLACIGIYGVVAYSVAQRTHEMGIRMALGAKANDVLRLIVGQGLKLSLIGVGAGLALAWGLARFMSGLLYGVQPADPATFLSAALVLGVVSLLASYIPALRAIRIDPVIALRAE